MTSMARDRSSDEEFFSEEKQTPVQTGVSES
jgi:hypothetical protein